MNSEGDAALLFAGDGGPHRERLELVGRDDDEFGLGHVVVSRRELHGPDGVLAAGDDDGREVDGGDLRRRLPQYEKIERGERGGGDQATDRRPPPGGRARVAGRRDIVAEPRPGVLLERGRDLSRIRVSARSRIVSLSF